MMKVLAGLAAAVALSAASACGSGVGNDGRSVGGPCTTDNDCNADSHCLTGHDFPGGTCALTCGTLDDCPSGTRCVGKEDGVCLLECNLPDDCRDGYTCKGVKNRSGGGESLVCID